MCACSCSNAQCRAAVRTTSESVSQAEDLLQTTLGTVASCVDISACLLCEAMERLRVCTSLHFTNDACAALSSTVNQEGRFVHRYWSMFCVYVFNANGCALQDLVRIAAGT